MAQREIERQGQAMAVEENFSRGPRGKALADDPADRL